MTDTTEQLQHDEHLDARGLNCPLPVLKAKVALTRMQPGQILYVEATDPHASIDFEAYCARTGHEIVQLDESPELIEIYVRRAEQPRKI